MGFWCSLLGHAFDESDVNRSREVRGDEVVTVIETIERCSRCGAERVVAENKEVVSVVNADDVDLDEAEMAAVAAGESPGAAGTDDAGADTDADPAESPGAGSDADTDADTEAGADDEGTGDAPEQPPQDPDEEDAEFITETDGSLGGGDEVNVDVDAEDVPEGGIGGMATRSGAYGDPPDDEDGSPAPERNPDAEILGEEERDDRAPGQWPDDPEAGDEPWEPGPLGGTGETDPEEPASGSDPQPDPERERSPPAEPAPDVEPTTGTEGAPADRLRCPACGHVVNATSSFRAGDACPECRADYLEPSGE